MPKAARGLWERFHARGRGLLSILVAAHVAASTSTWIGIEAEPTELFVAAQVFEPQPVLGLWTFRDQTDAFGNPIPTTLISESIAPNTFVRATLENVGSGSNVSILLGELETRVVCGKAVFTDLMVQKVGRYRLNFASQYLSTSPTNQTREFEVVPGAPFALEMTQSPNGFRLQRAFQQQPILEIHDRGANVVVDSTLFVRCEVLQPTQGVRIWSDEAGLQADRGIARFERLTCTFCIGSNQGLALSTVVASARLRFSAPGLSSVDTDTFDVSSWPPDGLIVSQAPDVAYAGMPFAMQPTVYQIDNTGYLITWEPEPNSEIEVQIRSRPGTIESLSGVARAEIKRGFARFTDLQLDFANQAYALEFVYVSATFVDIQPKLSPLFDVIFGQPAQLGMGKTFGAPSFNGTQPGGARPGYPMLQQPVVIVQDVARNWVRNVSMNITVELQQNGETVPDSGLQASSRGFLSCPIAEGVYQCFACTSIAADCGIFLFSGLRIDSAGQGFRLLFSSGSLQPAVSRTMNIATGPPFSLAMLQQPLGFRVDSAGRVQPQVEVVDEGGNRVSSAPMEVTPFLCAEDLSQFAGIDVTSLNQTDSCEVGHNLTALYLRSRSVPVRDGVADFTDLAIFTTGFGFSVRFCASDTTIRCVSSAAFNVTFTPIQLLVSSQPSDSVAGEPLAQMPIVLIADLQGVAAPWTPGGFLTVFSSVCLLQGNNATETWTCVDELTEVEEQAQSCPPPDPPPPLLDGIVPEVRLGGQTSHNAIEGIATFTDLTINRAGVFKLLFRSGGLEVAESDRFVVERGTAAKVAVLRSAQGTRPGFPFDVQPVVALQDKGGNLMVDDSTTVITAALLVSAEVVESIPVYIHKQPAAIAVERGLAWFQGLGVAMSGRSYQILYSAVLPSGDAASAASDAFYLDPGVPARLVVTRAPDRCSLLTLHNLPPSVCQDQPVISIADQAGNVVSTAKAMVRGEVWASPDALQPLATFQAEALFGVARFSNFSSPVASSGLVLRFESAGLEGAQISHFDASSVPHQLRLLGSGPGGGEAGFAVLEQPVVAVEDAAGRLVDADTGITVSASIALYPSCPSPCNIAAGEDFLSGAALLAPGSAAPVGGDRDVTALYGLAAFSDIQINDRAQCYVMVFSAPSLAPAVSLPFSIVSGVHRVVVVTTEPFGAVPGLELLVQPAVAVHDAGGNLRVEDSDSVITASLLGRPLSDLQGGTNKVLQVAGGRGQFEGLRIDVANPCLLMAFTSVGRDPGFSATFQVLPLHPVRLAFLPEASPSGPRPGQPFTLQPALVVEDEFGNRGNPRPGELWVEVELRQGGAATDCEVERVCLLGQPRATFERAGVAVFTDLRIDKTNVNSANYSLLFTSAGLASIESPRDLVVRTSSVVVGLGIVVDPDGFKQGQRFLRHAVVGIVDAGGNVVADSFPSTVSLQLEGDGEDGQSLGGTTIVLSENGVAHFEDLLVNRSKGNLTLFFSAFAVGLGFVRTKTFDVAGETASMAFVQQPVGGRAGFPLPAQPIVEARDAAGRLVTAIGPVLDRCSQCVVVSLREDDHLLQGNRTAVYVRGSAVFTDLRVDVAGAYTLVFFADSNVSVLSSPVLVTNQDPARLQIITQPRPAPAGSPLATQPVVTVQDPFGNLVLDRAVAVTAQLFQADGAGACVTAEGCRVPMLGANVVESEDGVADFASSGLGVVDAGPDFVFVFSSALTPNASSALLLVRTAPPYRMRFVDAPAHFYNGEVVTPFPIIQLEDRGGNLISANQSVAVTLHNMSGCANSSQPTTSFAQDAAEKPCGAAVEGLAVTQPWCVSEQVRDDAAAYCRQILDENATEGSFSLLPLEGSWPTHPSRSGYVVRWALSGMPNMTLTDTRVERVEQFRAEDDNGTVTYYPRPPLNLSHFEITFNATLTTNETDVFAVCVGYGTVNGTINASLGLYSQEDLRRLLQVNFTAQFFDFSPELRVEQVVRRDNQTGALSNETIVKDNTTAVLVSHTCIKYNLSETLATSRAVFPGVTILNAGVQLKLRFTLCDSLLDPQGHQACVGSNTSLAAIVLETSSFAVSGFPTRLITVSWPSQTGQGGTPFVEQPSFLITDANGRIFTKLSQISVSATLLANDGLSQCSVATPFRCQGTTQVCVVRASQCPQLAGGTERQQRLGVVEFADLAITTCNDVLVESFICLFGEYRVSFVAEGVIRFPNTTNVSISLPVQVSPSISIDLGVASQLLISVEPQTGAAQAGGSLQVQPQLYMLDAGGNRALDRGVVVRATLWQNDTNVTASGLAGAAALASFKGAVKFTDLALVVADLPFHLSFSIPSGTTVRAAASLQVLPGAAVRVAVDLEPSGAFGGEAFKVQPRCSVRDAWDNVAWMELVNVSAQLAPWSEGQGGVLCREPCGAAAALPQVEVATEHGVANFSSLAIDRVGSCYVLLFSSPSLSSATSAPFNVAAGPPFQLVLDRQPGSALPGYALGQQPVVCVCDVGSNPVPFNRDRVVASASRGGLALPLEGTVLERAVDGVVSFTDLTLLVADNGTVLTFTRFVGGMAPIDSTPLFVPRGGAHSLRVVEEAAFPAAGAMLGVQPVVRVEDAGGNLVPSADDLLVTAQLFQQRMPSTSPLNGPSCTAIDCVLPCFPPLSCPNASMRCPSCLPVDKRSFILPTNGSDAHYAKISPDVDPADVWVVPTVGGLANFSALSLETAGADFHIRFLSFPLRWIDGSARLAVATGAPRKLGFVARPSGFQADTPFREQPVLQLQDAGANRVFLSAGVVTASLWGSGDGGSSNGTVLLPARNLQVALVAGEAKFVNLRIDRAGAGLALLFSSSICYDLLVAPPTNSSGAVLAGNASNTSSAAQDEDVDPLQGQKRVFELVTGWYQTAPGCFPAYSGHLTVTDTPHTMAVARGPANSVAGQLLASQPVLAILDSSGRVVDYESGRRVVRVSLVADARRERAQLSGAITAVCCGGLCPFTDLSVDRGQAGYRLLFSSPPFPDLLSAPFDVVGPSRLAVARQPWGGLEGRPFSVQPIVVVTDEWGAVIPVNVSVTATVGGGSTAAGTRLMGSVAVNSSNGEARFTDLYVERLGARFVLAFASATLEGVLSAEFEVDAVVRPNACPADGVCTEDED